MNTQNIPSKREANNSSAFRKLFDDDEEHGIIPEPSPQFKKI